MCARAGVRRAPKYGTRRVADLTSTRELGGAGLPVALPNVALNVEVRSLAKAPDAGGKGGDGPGITNANQALLGTVCLPPCYIVRR
jgi:hypothetical protein